MDIKYRLQTWAADHWDRVQYPKPVRLRDYREPKPRLPFGTWLILMIVGTGCVVLGGAALAFMLFFVWPSFFG